MRYILTLILMVFCLTAMASTTAPEKTSLVISGFSYHLGRTYSEDGESHHFNEKNWGIGVQTDDLRWMLVQNSYSETSVVFMWTPKRQLTETAAIGLRLGAATGYGDTPVNMELAPVVGVEMDYRFNNIHLVPAFQFPTVFSLHMQIDY